MATATHTRSLITTEMSVPTIHNYLPQAGLDPLARLLCTIPDWFEGRVGIWGLARWTQFLSGVSYIIGKCSTERAFDWDTHELSGLCNVGSWGSHVQMQFILLHVLKVDPATRSPDLSPMEHSTRQNMSLSCPATSYVPRGVTLAGWTSIQQRSSRVSFYSIPGQTQCHTSVLCTAYTDI